MVGFSAEEPKVLDFQTQQYKLFPAIALAYSCWFAAEDVKRTYDRLYRTEVDKGNFGNVAEVRSFDLVFLRTGTSVSAVCQASKADN